MPDRLGHRALLLAQLLRTHEAASVFLAIQWGVEVAFNRKPCALCKNPMEYVELPALAGNEKSCRVTLNNVPIMVCANGHKRLVYSSFVTELMDALARPETTGLRVGPKHGLFRKRFRCHKCSFDIPAENTAIGEYKASVKLTDMTHPISVVLAMPVLKCGDCGNDQLAHESDLMQVFTALTHAFRSADVKPQ